MPEDNQANQPKTNGKTKLPIDKLFEPIEGSEDWTVANLDGSERELILPEDLREELDITEVDDDLEAN